MGNAVAIPVEKSMEILRAGVQMLPDAPSGEDAEAELVARILSAPTLEEAFEPTSAPSMGNLEGRAITLHAAFKKEGGLNKAVGFYLLLDVETKDDGTRAIYSSGSPRIIAEVIRAVQEDRLPLDCYVYVKTSRDTGNTSHWLVLEAPF